MATGCRDTMRDVPLQLAGEIGNVLLQKVTFLAEDSKSSLVENFSAETPSLSWPLASLLIRLEKVCVGESFLRCHSNAFFTSRWLLLARALDPSCNQNLPANHVGFNRSALTAGWGPNLPGKKKKDSLPPSLLCL